MKKIIKYITIALFCVYIYILLYILFLNQRFANNTDLTYWANIKRSLNLIPLKTIGEYIVRISNNTINTSIVLKNIFGNIILFIPMGFLLPCISRRFNKASKIIMSGAIFILSIELIQLFTARGSFDIDDIILNLFGLSIGFLIFKFKPINILLEKYIL